MKTRAVLLCVSLLGTAGCSSTIGVPVTTHPTASPAAPIAHVVILLQENRSFDNLFAGFPGADTTMQGKCTLGPGCGKAGQEIPLKIVKLKSGPVNRGTDIGHSHHNFEVECDRNASNVCQMDGFNLNGYGQSGEGSPAGIYPYAYVDRQETAPYWNLARRYTLADKMFSTDTASSFIAHQQLIAGTARWDDNASLTDQPNVTPWGCDAPGKHSGRNQIAFTPLLYRDGRVNRLGPFPCFSQYRTIADLLDAGKVSYNYYVDEIPNPVGDFSGAVWNGFDAIKDFRYGPDWHEHISRPNTNIFSDLRNAKLAAVSWVIPTLYDSDHPASGCNGGPLWVTKVLNAVGTSKYWNSTAVIIAWDDWGGWYDNVPPPQVNYTSLGFRIPMIIVSPYARPHHISHTQYDYGSVLRFIEQTFGLGTLGATDASANSIGDAFDFRQKPLAFKRAPLPRAARCATRISNPGSMKEIIDHDGGVPE
jgi:phospholipase C